MERRQYLAGVAGMLSVAGCTGIQDETITMLAVNQDDASHVVTVWVVPREELIVASTVDVASEDVEIDYDAVVVTHRHPDHWDPAAVEELDADVPLFCQPEEADEFREEGFTDVRPVEDEASFEGVTIHRTPGQHGHGDLAEGMGPVSGFVFEGDRTLYIAGDTIWYDPVKETLYQFEPDMVVLNGGEAQFDQGEAITMGVEDITAVREATDATVAVVHMEAINHCLLSREELEAETENVLVPEDGERISL